MQLAQVFAAGVEGVDGYLVQVEVSRMEPVAGVGRTTVVGLPDAAVRESVERITPALVSAGMILPGAVIVTGLGFAYVALRHDPKVAVVLTGVAAAAVGLLLQVTLKIGWKQLISPRDLALVVVVFVLVGIFHVSLLVTLVAVAPLAIWMHRPRREKEAA